MMLLYLLLPLFISSSYGDDSSIILYDYKISSFCRPNVEYIQLGPCSTHFLHCHKSHAAIRKCNLQSHVFINGKCRHSNEVEECSNREINKINRETQQLVLQSSFCSNGAAVYLAKEGFNKCSRQGIICEYNRRDVITITCPHGSIFNDFNCIPSPSTCSSQLYTTAPIRQFFLNTLCYSESSKTSPGIDRYQNPQCQTWYIKCSPTPSIVECSSDNVYDSSINQCRSWNNKDQCQIVNRCVGNEWKSIPVSECNNQFIYCEGSVGKLYACPMGTVFYESECRQPEGTICQRCRVGDRRGTDKCDILEECTKNSNGQLEWKRRKCKDGKSFNEYTKRCQTDYTCTSQNTCKLSTWLALSCYQYMYCTGTSYEYFECAAGQSFDTTKGLCRWDPSCRSIKDVDGENSCNSGTMAIDCNLYKKCIGGKWETFTCKDESGNIADACMDCSSSNSNIDHNSFPADCKNGEIRSHSDDCMAFYRCDRSQWIYSRCDNGNIFDGNQCSPPSSTSTCSTSIQTQCTNGQRIIHPDSSQCDRLVECRNGIWIDLQCPNGLIYDEKLFGCVEGSCISSSSPSFPFILPPPEGRNEGPPPPPPTDFDEVRKNGIASSCQGSLKIIDRFDCTRFFECNSNGRFIAMQCPSGTHYDDNRKECMQGDCGSSSLCQQGWYQPLQLCGYFKLCDKGRWIDARCDNNKVFLNGICVQNECPVLDSSWPSSQQCVFDEIQAIPSDIHSYKLCYYGKWETRKCPSNYLFDWKTLTCIPHVSQYNPTNPNCYSGQRRQINNECQLYEVCDYGEWIRKSCYYGYKYVNGYCVPGDCTIQKPCMESGGSDGYRRAAHDCSKYYQCVHGNWMLRDCAPGTFWNDRITTCDHKGNVVECVQYSGR